MFVSRQGLRDGTSADRSGASVADAYAALAASGLSGDALLRRAIRDDLRGRIAVVSSFGAESVLLLALVADIDPATPVLFLQTDRHFDETLAYREDIAAHLGLTGVRDLRPDPVEAERDDPTGELWHYDAESCCALRKVRPLDRALDGFDAWVTGRKRHQAATREHLAFVELDAGRIKLNPLANWDHAEVERAIEARGLPRHKLVAAGYRSIGCANCTRAVGEGEDARAGRWAGLRKVECGIHRAA